MRRTAAGVVALLAIGVVVSCGTTTAEDQDAIDTVSAGSAQESGHAELVMGFPGPIHELAYDTTTDTIWLAEITSGSPDRLWRVDAASGDTTSYTLHDVDHNGYMSHVRLASDGAV